MATYNYRACVTYTLLHVQRLCPELELLTAQLSNLPPSLFRSFPSYDVITGMGAERGPSPKHLRA